MNAEEARILKKMSAVCRELDFDMFFKIIEAEKNQIDAAFRKSFIDDGNEDKEPYEKQKTVIDEIKHKYICMSDEERLSAKEDYKKTFIVEKDESKEDVEFNFQEEEDFDIFSTRGQVERFYRQQPFYYDHSKIFYLWNWKEFKYEISDETDYLNLIQKKLGVNTLNSKKKNELIEGFKQVGRDHKPDKFKPSWIQFKDIIVDVMTGERIKASPKFLCFQPLPYSLGRDTDTPTIDKLFSQWVGQKNIVGLQELNSYIISPNQFMQRIFALCGGGSNGKGTFMKFTKKLTGDYNCVSSELKALSEDKFEPAVLFGKLLCVMGEVSSDDLRNTNFIKKMAGEDDISFQFKGKTPFTSENTATGVCLTNSLPTTPDKTIGFYRKWHIIDFPNQFTGVKKDLIGEIPEIEFENYMLKCLETLRKLYKTNKFTNEGNFEERMNRYEERSNPILKFIEDYCEEDYEGYTPLSIFNKELNDYLRKKHFKVYSPKEVKKYLLDEGYEVTRTTRDYKRDYYLMCFKLKSVLYPKNPKNPKNSNSFLIVESTSNKLDKLDKLDKKDLIREKSSKILNFLNKYWAENQKSININDLRANFSDIDNIDEILEILRLEGLIFEERLNFWRIIG